MSPPKMTHWTFFSLNSMEFVIFNQIFSIFFVFWGGALPHSKSGALCLYGPLWWQNPLFCPLRNKFLATPLTVAQLSFYRATRSIARTITSRNVPTYIRLSSSKQLNISSKVFHRPVALWSEFVFRNFDGLSIREVNTDFQFTKASTTNWQSSRHL